MNTKAKNGFIQKGLYPNMYVLTIGTKYKDEAKTLSTTQANNLHEAADLFRTMFPNIKIWM